MSVAKASIVNMIKLVPDDIQDEMGIIESLYKIVKLEKSRTSAKINGTLSTEEVRSYFENKTQRKDLNTV